VSYHIWGSKAEMSPPWRARATARRASHYAQEPHGHKNDSPEHNRPPSTSGNERRAGADRPHTNTPPVFAHVIFLSVFPPAYCGDIQVCIGVRMIYGYCLPPMRAPAGDLSSVRTHPTVNDREPMSNLYDNNSTPGPSRTNRPIKKASAGAPFLPQTASPDRPRTDDVGQHARGSVEGDKRRETGRDPYREGAGPGLPYHRRSFAAALLPFDDRPSSTIRV
jgi:hypothetical protein